MSANIRIDDETQGHAREIIKRSGERAIYEPYKVYRAIEKANLEEKIESRKLTNDQIDKIVDMVSSKVYLSNRPLGVEEIQDLVEIGINQYSFSVFKLYHDYRFRHNEQRNTNGFFKKIAGIVELEKDSTGTIAPKSEAVKEENSNKNPVIVSVERDYVAGETSKEYSRQMLIPEDILRAHDEGIIHFHDMDYFIQKIHNCCLINLSDMLDNGTKISGVTIDSPKSLIVAATVTSQIVAQVASSQYGGQTISLSALAPYVDVSRKKIRNRQRAEWESVGIKFTNEQLESVVEEQLQYEIDSAIQTIQYQLITLQTTNGQAPFVTVFMYLHEVPEGQIREDLARLIESMLRQRLKGVKNDHGHYVTPAFPKLIYVLQDDNIEEGTKYWYLTELAAKCTAKRMVPDYISEKIMNVLKGGDVYPCMGCRSFLTPDRFSETKGNMSNAKNYVPWKHKYYGRFNQGVVTINLVDAALSSGGNEEKFWNILNERLELCHKALQLRHNRLMGTPSDVAPILWQDGALARLKPGETIDKLLFDGYSTISLGYAGLAETVYYMKHVSHTTEEGKEFGLKVMQALNDACTKWKKAENIDYSVYGTPLESTTYKFAKCLQRRFGTIKGVTDKNYITNSYHVRVTEKIDAFSKLSKETPFQVLSPGGAVSYVEVPNMQNNIPAVLAVMKHIYNTILYAELNTKSDYCDICGYDGEMKIIEDHGKLIWECPNCGNRDQNKMSVARRTCGYIGTQYWNQGRTQEIKERVLHL